MKAPIDASPLVSIVTPAFNVERFLMDTIRSAQAQTYPHWEMLLVVDTKSTDSTLEIAKTAGEADPRIKVIHDENCNSLSANRNLAMDLAQGEYLAFLDSDDLWLPQKLEMQVRFMTEKKINFSYHSYGIINEEGHQSGPPRRARHHVGKKDLLRNNCIGCLSVMLRRSFVGSRRMQAIRHEDLLFWLQLLERDLAYAIPDKLAQYRVRRNSVSANKIRSALWRWRIYRSLGLSIPKSLFYMMFYFYFALRKRI